MSPHMSICQLGWRAGGDFHAELLPTEHFPVSPIPYRKLLLRTFKGRKIAYRGFLRQKFANGISPMEIHLQDISHTGYLPMEFSPPLWLEFSPPDFTPPFQMEIPPPEFPRPFYRKIPHQRAIVLSVKSHSCGWNNVKQFKYYEV